MISVRSEVQIFPGPPMPRACDRIRGCSSAGRAPALQAGGHRFDPGQLHQFLRAQSAARQGSYAPATCDDRDCASSRDVRIGVGCLVEAPACGSYFERGTRISFAPLQRRDRDVALRGALFLIVDKNAVAADRVFPDAQVPMHVRFRHWKRASSISASEGGPQPKNTLSQIA